MKSSNPVSPFTDEKLEAWKRSSDALAEFTHHVQNDWPWFSDADGCWGKGSLLDFFSPPEGLCLLWFCPTSWIFHLLPLCSLPSQASVAFSSVSLIRADFHVCVLMSNLFSFSYKTFLSLWSHCKMILFRLVSVSVVDLIFLVILICCITPFSFHSSRFKDTLEAFKRLWWENQCLAFSHKLRLRPGWDQSVGR